MATNDYIIKHSDTSLPDITVSENSTDKSTDLILIGHGFPAYGAWQNTNFLHLLENFASSTDEMPKNPIVGQLWFKKLDGGNNSQTGYVGLFSIELTNRIQTPVTIEVLSHSNIPQKYYFYIDPTNSQNNYYEYNVESNDSLVYFVDENKVNKFYFINYKDERGSTFDCRLTIATSDKDKIIINELNNNKDVYENVELISPTRHVYSDTNLSNSTNSVQNNAVYEAINNINDNMISNEIISTDISMDGENLVKSKSIYSALQGKSNNEHIHTIDDVEDLSKELNAKTPNTSFTSHVNNRNNPHGVTKAQLGLGNVQNIEIRRGWKQVKGVKAGFNGKLCTITGLPNRQGTAIVNQTNSTADGACYCNMGSSRAGSFDVEAVNNTKSKHDINFIWIWFG